MDTGLVNNTGYINTDQTPGTSVISNDTNLINVDVDFNKTVVESNVRVNDTFTFKVTIKNNGIGNLTGIWVSEVFPEGIEYVGWVQDPDWKQVNSTYWTYNKVLEPGQSVSLYFKFK